MEEDNFVDQATDQYELESSNLLKARPAVPKILTKTLVSALLHYKDVYPLVQRGIQLLYQDLTDIEDNGEEMICSIKFYIDTGALKETVCAMTAKLESPAFVSSCLELLTSLIDKAPQLMADALEKTEILAVLDNMAHCTIYQSETAIMLLAITLLSKLVRNVKVTEKELWTRLISTTVQAMLTNPLNNALQSVCLLSLELVLQSKVTAFVPPHLSDLLLKTLVQLTRPSFTLSTSSSTAAMVIIARIVDGSPVTSQIAHIASILATVLYHYQLAMGLNESHKLYVEKLIQQPPQAAVFEAVTQLSGLLAANLSPTELVSTDRLTKFQDPAIKLLLSVVWRQEARAFLDRGGVAILANILMSEVVPHSTFIEAALAQIVYNVSKYWPNETWNAFQVIRTGLTKWVELMSQQCAVENDVVLYYLLAMTKNLVDCEGFAEAFSQSNAVDVYQSVLHKRRQLPLCAHLSVESLIVVWDLCPAPSLPALCCSVAETMCANEGNQPFQLDCVKALSLLTSRRSDSCSLLSNQAIQNIMCAMRSRQMDEPFIAEMMTLVANVLTNNASLRAAFIDQGLLQVVLEALSTFRWNSTDSVGLHARWIVCDVAQKFDVLSNLSVLKSCLDKFEKHTFDVTTTSLQALTAYCSAIEAIACVKPLLYFLIEEGAISCIIGVLRYIDQEPKLCNGNAVVQLVTTCFHAANNIVNAPIVTEIMKDGLQDTHNAMTTQSIFSQLTACGADGVVIKCLEEALRIEEFPSLLVESGCRLLQAMVSISTSISNKVKNQWIGVAILLLQEKEVQPMTRELLFGTTLMILSRRKQMVESAHGQHIKLMKVLVDFLDHSIKHVRSCTLLQTEFTGAVRVLEELFKSSIPLPDTVVTRCLGVLGKLASGFVLSPSTTAQDQLQLFDKAIALFASREYVKRLLSRLDQCPLDKVGLEGATMVDMIDQFEALAALLYSSHVNRIFVNYHPLFGHLAAIVEHYNAYAQVFGAHAQFFLELGCLSSRLLSTAWREKVINDALCYLAENTNWHSMRWIAGLADKSCFEFTLIAEFVLLRIVSSYTILEPALLLEHLDALCYLLRWDSCRELVLASSHVSKLQRVLWQLVPVNVALMQTASGGYDGAVSLLGIISSLLSFDSKTIFSVQYQGDGSERLVCFCLETLDQFLSNTTFDLVQIMSMENVLLSTSTILQLCIQLSAEHARFIMQHRGAWHAFNNINSPGCKRWTSVVLGAVIQFHGLIRMQTLLHFTLKQPTIIINFASIVAHTDVFSWKHFLDCLALVNKSPDWQADCVALFKELQQQTSRLVSEQVAGVNSRQIKTHVSNAVALLSFKYGHLCLETSRDKLNNCVEAITQAALSFHDLFMSASAFEIVDYSVIVSLHLKIAQLAVSCTSGNDKDTSAKSADMFRLVLGPIGISDEALAAYFDWAVIKYLVPSTQAAAQLFIDTTTQVLYKVIQRLSSGLIRSKCLEKSLLDCFTSLQAICTTQWESREVASIVKLLKICSSDTWAREHLLKTVLALPDGFRFLFKVTQVAPVYDGIVIVLLFEHLRDNCHKAQHIGEPELRALLSIIKRNLAGKAGDIFQQKWTNESGSELLRCALKILKLFVRQKNGALLCSKLGGISILRDVICAPSHYHDSTLLAFETCCSLAHCNVDVAHDTMLSIVQQLIVFTEFNEDCSRSHLAGLILKFILSVKASALSLPLIQQCRTQLVPKLVQTHETTAMYTQELYIARQKLVSPIHKLEPQASDLSTKIVDKSSALRLNLNKGEMRTRILLSCRSIVQCSDQVEATSYVCLSTSEKSLTEPLEYTRLRKAIKQMDYILNESDMVMNRDYLSALVPALSEILTLHQITTATMCTIMLILDQIAFANPLILLLNDELDVPALFASCSLHQRSSLRFARHLARFCSCIGAESKTLSGNESEPSIVALISMVFELLQHWSTDFEIIDQCVATLAGLFAAVDGEKFERYLCSNTLNTAVASHVSNSSVSWNWLKCILEIDKFDKLPVQLVQDTSCSVMRTIRMFVRHDYIVEMAVLVLLRMCRKKWLLSFQLVIESDGANVLITCLKLHVNDKSIVASCLELIINLSSATDALPECVKQLSAAKAATSILLVTKKYFDIPLICKMCIKLVRHMVEPFKTRSDMQQSFCLPKDALDIQRELLNHLLEAKFVSLIFDVLDFYSKRGDYCLLEPLLLLLKMVTNDESMREDAETLHGLHELQQTIDRIWNQSHDVALIEMAVDCLVNLVSSDRAIGHGWKEFLWCIDLAESLHNTATHRNGTCIEKLIKILKRLTIDNVSSSLITPKGSFTLLQLLACVESNYSLEQALYGLLCALCKDTAYAQVLIVIDAIPITAKRIICHVDDFETVLSSLAFLNVLVMSSGETSYFLLDGSVVKALQLAIQTYPESHETQIYGIASTLLDKLSALDCRSTLKPTQALEPRPQILDSEKPFYDLLRKGAKFRVLWEARPDRVETIQIHLAPTADYLLFRQKEPDQQPKVERIFVSQLQVCPQRSLVKAQSPPSPSKKILARSILNEKFEGDHVLRLRIREEDVFVKTTCLRERVCWDQALQWLLAHRKASMSPVYLQPRHSS